MEYPIKSRCRLIFLLFLCKHKNSWLYLLILARKDYLLNKSNLAKNMQLKLVLFLILLLMGNNRHLQVINSQTLQTYLIFGLILCTIMRQRMLNRKASKLLNITNIWFSMIEFMYSYPLSEKKAKDSDIVVYFDRESLELKQFMIRANSLNITNQLILYAV